MENWRTFNNDKSLMLLEVEFNKILKEEEAVLNDFQKLIEHYTSGSLLLEHNEALLIEKKLSKTRNAKAIQEIKKNPKMLSEASAILTAASIPTAVGLMMRGMSLFLEKGVELYLDKFANQELPEEYVARLSSQESIEMGNVDPAQVPSIAGAAGRGRNPNEPEFLQLVKDERKAEAYAEINKYLKRKMPKESDEQYQQRTSKPPEENMSMVAKLVLNNNPAMLRGRATLLKPTEKKIILAILKLAENSEDLGNYAQNFVKMVIKKIVTFIGGIINKICRSEEEATDKKQKVEKACENLSVAIYCGLIAAGATYLFGKAVNIAIPPAYGANAVTNLTNALEAAKTSIEAKQVIAAKAEAIDSITTIKSTLSNVSDAALTGAKVEKTTHFKHYIHQIMEAIKKAGTNILVETFDLFADCVGKPFGIKNAGEKVVGAVSNTWNKIKGWWNKEDNNPTTNTSPLERNGGIRERRIR